MAPKRTIRTKLLWLTILSTGVALLTACFGLAVYDHVTFRAGMIDDVRMTARMIAENITAAVSFDDAKEAGEILAAVGVDPKLTAAAVYDAGGRCVARRSRGTVAPDAAPTVIRSTDSGLQGDAIVQWEPVNLNGKTIGSVYVRSNLVPLHERTWSYCFVLGSATLAAMAIALALSIKLNKRIVGPILQLSGVVRCVSESRDYSVRGGPAGDDELGVLVTGFNTMLEQIQQRDEQLTMHRNHLEERVQARTAELMAAKEEADEANRAKTAFLANMSHEIRTPMAAVLGYADLMLTPSQTMSDRINCLQVVRRNAKHLMDLINDILDISKIEAEKMTVEKIPGDAAQIVMEVVSLLRPRALTKGLSLDVDFVGPIPASVQTDGLRLKQVLMNLIGNALKFTHAGGVRVRMAVETVPGSSRARFDISDTGIGMTPEQFGRLFKPFVQADESMTRKYGGTGLGLVISKRLATIMGGDITVTSSPDQGSTFSFYVDGGPLDGVPMREGLTESMLSFGPEPTDGQAITLSGKILLAEDGVDNQHLLTMYLTMAGAEVTVAENGQIAIDLLRNEAFNVVLMDMQMPVLDGYSAATQLRRSGCQLPIIALTAHAMSGDRTKCLNAGCTDYLTKPVDRELLIRTVDGYLKHPSAANWKPAPAAKRPPATKTPAAASGDVVAMAMLAAVEGFVARMPGRVQTLLTLVANNDLDALGRAVHQLKGSGTGYGFPAISRTAARAEAAIKADAGIEAVREGVDELVALLRATQGYDIQKEAGHVASDTAAR